MTASGTVLLVLTEYMMITSILCAYDGTCTSKICLLLLVEFLSNLRHGSPPSVTSTHRMATSIKLSTTCYRKCPTWMHLFPYAGQWPVACCRWPSCTLLWLFCWYRCQPCRSWAVAVCWLWNFSWSTCFTSQEVYMGISLCSHTCALLLNFNNKED